MRKLIAPFALVFFYSVLNAQSYIGFGADNFNGVHGVLFNPANIADSRTKVDVNLASASLFALNNYYEINYWDWLTKKDADFDQLSSAVGIDRDNYGFVNADVLGPSVMITLNEKHSVALTTRARSITNANNINGEVINYFDEEGLDNDLPLFVTGVNSSAVSNNWTEVGATYARVLKNTKVRFMKAGISLKYLFGIASTNITLDNVSALGGANELFFVGNGGYTYSGSIDAGDRDGIPFSTGDDFDFNLRTRGVGIDLGFVYEYRPRHRSNVSREHVKEQLVIRHVSTYKYKLGISILDIGAITYASVQKAYTGTTVSKNELLTGNYFDDIEPLFNPEGPRIVNNKFSLPTRLRAEFDYKVKDRFYVNAVTNLTLVSRENAQANRHATQFSLSPRYETKWFSMYSPITVSVYGGVQWGAGFRLGPLFMGSGSLFSRAIDRETRSFDVYAGLKIPFYHKTPRREEDDDHIEQKNRCKNCRRGQLKSPPKYSEGGKG
ncbi:DUF5723 family protein [Aquimarina agarilytica]|uniref:DUF5723 family protein n=1 Tax=Aquimarina agarilytica TaxID=1087449 RepID=UPI0002888296|nr:DUF5723 family protein [Aquimarina agarilytica]